MSNGATMSVMGLYEWDNTLFELMSIPEGMNKDNVINFLLAEVSDLEVLYPNPVVMKNLIGIWSASCQYKWQRLYNTMLLEYNPIDNYDRTETRTLNSQGSGTNTTGGSDTIPEGGSDTITEGGSDTITEGGSDTVTEGGTDTTSGNTTTSEKVAGFNSSPSALVDKGQQTGQQTGTTQYGKTVDTDFGKTVGTDYGKTQETEYGKTLETEYGKTLQNSYGKTGTDSFTRADSETIRARGNIGVTTTQQMIESEREVADFNMYDIIVSEFKQRFCLLVY